jgi:hypothetical protein
MRALKSVHDAIAAVGPKKAIEFYAAALTDNSRVLLKQHPDTPRPVIFEAYVRSGAQILIEEEGRGAVAARLRVIAEELERK